MRKAWDNAVESIRAGITGNLQSGTDQNAGWVAGRVAGQIEGAWWTQVIHDTAPDLSGKWRIAKQPERPGNRMAAKLDVTRSRALGWESRRRLPDYVAESLAGPSA